MGERLRHGLKLRNKHETGVGPLKGKNQSERLELSQTRSLAASVRATVSALAAIGRKEKHQTAAEA